MIPLRLPEKLAEPKGIRDIIAYIEKHLISRTHFHVVNIGWTTGTNRKRDKEKVIPYIDAGITWWLESLYMKQDSPEKMRKRIRQGPSN